MSDTLPVAESRSFAYAIIIIGVVGCISNALVILAILSSRRLRARAINVLLVSMVND